MSGNTATALLPERETRTIEQEYSDFRDPSWWLENEEGDRPEWKITTLAEAEWLIKKIKEQEERMAKVDAFVKKEKEYLDEYRSTQETRLRWKTEKIKEKLREFAERELAGTDERTLKLPAGDLSFYKMQTKFAHDDKKLLAYMKENAPEYIKTKTEEKPDWNRFKKEMKLQGTDTGAAVTKDGEVIPGVFVEREAMDAFKVVVKGGTEDAGNRDGETGNGIHNEEGK